jgi:hypothetical protein
MTDSFQFDSDNLAPDPPTLPDRPVAVELPLAIAAAIAQRMEESGQTQAQIILEALQLLLSPAQVLSPDQPQSAEDAELRSLKQRLAHLETLIPRMTALEGKSIAF